VPRWENPLAVALVAMLTLLLTSASTPSAAIQSNRPISCVINIRVVCPYNDKDCTGGYWEGPITHCILEGMRIQFWETERNFWPGHTEHFFELFYILDGEGNTVISGHDAGVWNFSTFKFRANGWVVDATGPWAYLRGYAFHEMGRTSDPGLMDPPQGITITGFGTVMTLH
jgi:hypothetical protein